jgi:hypothetical protein
MSVVGRGDIFVFKTAFVDRLIATFQERACVMKLVRCIINQFNVFFPVLYALHFDSIGSFQAKRMFLKLLPDGCRTDIIVAPALVR